MEVEKSIRVLCPKLVINKNEPSLQWLIGSPFFPPLTIISTFRCIHTLSPPNTFAPNYDKESEDLRSLLLKGFQIIGALIVSNNCNLDQIAGEAVGASGRMTTLLEGENNGGKLENQDMIGAVADSDTGNIHFFVARSKNLSSLQRITKVDYEDHPENYIWKTGCLLRCELPIKLPFYFPKCSPPDAEKIYMRATEAVVAKFKDPQAAYILEMSNKTSAEVPQPVLVRMDFHGDFSNIEFSREVAQDSDTKFLSCAHFCSKTIPGPPVISAENTDTIQVSVVLNRSEKSLKSAAPVAEYFPVLEETRLLVVDFKLEVLCYAAKDLLLTCAISKLIIPGLVDQLNTMKNTILPNLFKQHPQLRPYHFNPPGLLHPVTVIYALGYGETEMKQVEIRRSLHLRLGLPLDRPLLRIANALDLSMTKDIARRNLIQKGSSLLKDVHIGIPSSGVSGGFVSVVQGSYEYYHYLQDGIDDSGWGCAYRSLQTIVSWFRLQHYTPINVPSHREIQQSLVEIGDKDPSFVGSREWIGAIELSFVLDKLLGVSCKVMNVRSGAELPEKCRELALHFENQGTPIMIGGGVLAYTLLGVDFNEVSGDCAFLILDPHYTGNDEHKKIVNGGWCGWKKAVDSKGNNFFLHDKFYNLLMPQRPNMV